MHVARHKATVAGHSAQISMVRTPNGHRQGVPLEAVWQFEDQRTGENESGTESVLP